MTRANDPVVNGASRGGGRPRGRAPRTAWRLTTSPIHRSAVWRVVSVSVFWRSAAAPISPPMPIDSSALLGTSISAPFSLRPS